MNVSRSRDASDRVRLDTEALRRLLGVFEGARVTLCSRTCLDDRVVASVHDALCEAAGREIAVETHVVPTMDAGAVLHVGDTGRIVLDPRVMWLSSIERELKDHVERGELTDAKDVFQWLAGALAATCPEPAVEQLSDTGHVVRVGDGVAVVAGLRDAGSQEAVEFEGGVQGIAFTLREQEVGVVLLGDERAVREGSDVRRLGHAVRVPVGEALLGRVVDALGRPMDGMGGIVPESWYPVERAAPRVVDRSPVDTPLHTGIKAIDALVPIGRGQRELIVGDRSIGKSSIAIDTILAQKDRDVACVYCAIGQKASTVASVVATLREEGALAHTAVVTALPADPPAYRYLAPYAACAIGEYFMDRGGDALVVFDDLSKHAVTYREISALLERPVGREAYPGDIFYVHSRLLERAGHLSAAQGGGSLTALPIVETLAGDISAFIPTNVISICDGQIVLDAASFNEGRRPAMDSGLSVSRVGGSAQSAGLKKVAGRLRIDLAQFEEMARFVKFGAEVDEATQQQLTRGERARELLRQPLHRPLTLEQEVVVLFAVINGQFDRVPMERIGDAEAALLTWAEGPGAHLAAALAGTAGAPPADTPELREAIAGVLAGFESGAQESDATESVFAGSDKPVEAEEQTEVADQDAAAR